MLGMLTVVSAPAWLSAGTGSGVDEVALAVFVIVAPGLGATVVTIVMVTSPTAPASTAPRSQVTVVVPEQLPFVGEAETSVTLSGSGSVTVTASAGSGPELCSDNV